VRAAIIFRTTCCRIIWDDVQLFTPKRRLRNVCGVGSCEVEVQHQRIFTRLPAKDTSIEVECEARDPAALEQLVVALEAAGFKVERASLD
jgi:hypothetical protein